MKQRISYRYLGVNGVIDSPVLLEGIYSVKTITLIADEGHKLTKDGVNFVDSVKVPESEVSEWREVGGKSK